MIWDSWSDFFAMGGYALYVWASFGVVFAVMAAELGSLMQRDRTIRAQLRKAARPAAPRGGSRP
jgi:heme exporter protein D